MRKLFDFKKVINKNDGKSAIVIIVIVVLLMLVAIGSSEETNTNLVENYEIINEENLQVNVEKINDEIINENNDKYESNINEERNSVFEINESTNTEKNEKVDFDINTEKVNDEDKIDLNKLKDDELAKIPLYSGSPYYAINNNKPFFYDIDLVTTSYEKYSNLDSLR